MTVRIDLNADLGESFGTWVLGDDEAMLDVVTSANVACGFHAGDATTIRRTVAAAAERGVVVGAQVGYRDLAGFGRRRIDMDAADLTADVLYQLGALEAMCRVAGTRVAYVKPHGALYTTAAVDEVQARAVVDAVPAYDPTLPLLGHPGSVLLRVADDGRAARWSPRPSPTAATPPTAGSCPARTRGALLTDPDEVADRVVRHRDRGDRARRRRHARRGAGAVGRAPTGTPRVPWRWPAPCAPASRRPASPSRPFVAPGPP